jgi:hypothetical protein
MHKEASKELVFNKNETSNQIFQSHKKMAQNIISKINPKKQFEKEMTEFPCKFSLIDKIKKNKYSEDKKSSDL